MRWVFRRTGILVPCIAAALLITGCAKQPPAAEPVSPPQPLQLEAAAPEDKTIIVARVNGTEISRYALIDMMNRMNAINQRMSTPEPPEVIRKKALDQLVLQELALQEAARQGLHVEDPVIDKAMEKYITSLGHEEGYQEFLAKQHLTAMEFRSQVERSLLVQQILIKEVVQKASVPAEAVRNEYEQHKDQYVTSEGPRPFEEVSGAIDQKLRATALQKRRQEWEQELKKDAKIELLDVPMQQELKKP